MIVEAHTRSLGSQRCAGHRACRCRMRRDRPATVSTSSTPSGAEWAYRSERSSRQHFEEVWQSFAGAIVGRGRARRHFCCSARAAVVMVEVMVVKVLLPGERDLNLALTNKEKAHPCRARRSLPSFTAPAVVLPYIAVARITSRPLLSTYMCNFLLLCYNLVSTLSPDLLPPMATNTLVWATHSEIVICIMVICSLAWTTRDRAALVTQTQDYLLLSAQDLPCNVAARDDQVSRQAAPQ